MKINNEPFLNPRVNCHFEMCAAPNGISILQHISDGSQPIAIFNSLDKSVEFFGGLDTPNFYNKAEVGNLITNLNLVNLHTKNQVDTLIYNMNLVGYYTKTEVDTQLPGYATITYLQCNYMISISITETLMNNYASITFLVGNSYDRTYLYNQIAGLVSTGYLNLKYTNSVDLSTNYFNKIGTGSLLANKIATTGYASISGNLNVAGRISIHGSHLNVQPKSSTSSETFVFDQSMSSEFGSDPHAMNVYGRQGGNSHQRFCDSKSGSLCNVLTYGNLDVGKVLISLNFTKNNRCN